jgi:integrase
MWKTTNGIKVVLKKVLHMDNDELLNGSEHGSELSQEDHPLMKYLNSLAPGSRRTLLPALERIAHIRSNGQDTALTHDWRSIDESEMLRVQQALQEKYKPATVNKMMSALRGVLRELPMRSDTLREESRVPFVPPLETSPSSQRGRVIGFIAIKALLGVCAKDRSPLGVRDAALIAVFLGTGLRRAEAVLLKVSDYHASEKRLYVRDRKGEIDRFVPVSETVCQTLNDWLSVRGTQDGFLFLSLDKTRKFNNTQMDEHTTAYAITRRSREAGIIEVSPIDLRFTYINLIYEQTHDLYQVQKLSGLSSIQAVLKHVQPLSPEVLDTVSIPYYDPGSRGGE